MPRLYILIALLAAGLLSFSEVFADETIGGACSGTVAAGAQAANGNNVLCLTSTWGYPAYQFGSTTASCSSSTAGMVQWNGSNFQGCNGGAWGSVDTVELILGSITTTNPFISASVTNGLYTAGAATVDVGISGTNRAAWISTGETVNGTETAKSYIPSGSTIPANGMYLSAANTLDFSTNSAKRVELGSTGNLNITTTAGALQLGGVSILAYPDADVSSLAIMTSALGNQSNTGLNNTAAGYLSGEFVSSGANNTANGQSALLGTTANKLIGSNNTAIGDSALLATISTAANNTAVGQDAGAAITLGSNNTIMGSIGNTVVPSTLTTGSGDIYMGYANSNVALSSTTSAIVMGYYVVGGSQDIVIGAASYACTLNNCQNTVIGNGDPQTSAAGTNDVAVGAYVLQGLTTGSYNTGLGGQNFGGVMANCTTCSYNSAVGNEYALNNITSGNYNTSIGGFLNSITTANGNTSFGISTFQETTASPNTGFGDDGLGYTLGNGSNNTLMGSEIMTNGTEGAGTQSYNVGIGDHSLYNLAGAAAGNASVGASALYSLTTGQFNTALGANAGYAGTGLTVGTNTTLIGYSAQANANNYTNSTALGNAAIITASNAVVLGNSSISTIYGQVTTITGISDRRLKKDIADLDDNLGLAFIDKLKPVSYRYNNGDETLRYGFIAQDMEVALPKDAQEIVETAEPDHGIALIERGNDKNHTYRVGYSELIAPIVKTIQQQQAELAVLKNENEKQSEKLSRLRQRIDVLKGKT